MISVQCCVLFIITVQNWDFAIMLWSADHQLISASFETVFIQVHIRVASPPIRFPCYMGINIPTKEELIANRPEFHDLANYIGKCCFLFFSWESFQLYFIVYFKIKQNISRHQWQNWLKNCKVGKLGVCIGSTPWIKTL